MIDVNHEQLNSLFKESERPLIKDVTLSGNTALIDLYVPADLAWFEGHFPEQAVLPGVVQVHWAGKLGQALLVQNGSFTQLSNVKFQSMVLPSTHMQIELAFNPEKSSVKFRFFNDNDAFSTGILKFTCS